MAAEAGSRDVRMSRSFRRVPIIGRTTSESDKPYKVAEHRRERRTVRQLIPGGGDLPAGQAFGNLCKSPKDGKQWWDDPRARRK